MFLNQLTVSEILINYKKVLAYNLKKIIIIQIKNFIPFII